MRAQSEFPSSWWLQLYIPGCSSLSIDWSQGCLAIFYAELVLELLIKPNTAKRIKIPAGNGATARD